jgi:polyisoprenoid-binding protein YceI
MKRSTLLWSALAVVLLAGGAYAYLFWFAGGSGEPSTELTTPELTGTTAADVTSQTTAGPDSTVGSDGAAVSFVIDQGQSTASFTIDEVLRGEPKTVVGTTDQVAGQVAIDPADLSSAELSEIVVNARTFITDSQSRDRAIRGPVILDSGSDEHELITFTPTSVESLEAGSATVGEEYEFTVTGDLTIRGVTNTVPFDVVVQMADDQTITGTATTTVLRSDFEIGIPNVPQVADVSDAVIITVNFTALSA